MKLFTIGTSRTTAANFFSRLVKSGATALVDIRLRNTSSLVGWAKRDDLCYFTNSICRIPYRHELQLSPTSKLLDDSRRPDSSWASYEREFLALMAQRQVEGLGRELFDGACLLCSEDKPDHCHRRLVAEYLKERWGYIEIVHL
jgi:uncharacterized protein (DUF488 family)